MPILVFIYRYIVPALIKYRIFCNVDILNIYVDMSSSLGYRDMAIIATNDDPSTLQCIIF